MALTRCWRQRTKAIPAQVTWDLLGIILELPWVASGPRGVPWGGSGVSLGVARAGGSSAGKKKTKQLQSHIIEPIPVFSFPLETLGMRHFHQKKKKWEWGQEWHPGFGEHVGTALLGLSCWKDLWGGLGSRPGVGQRENSWERWDPNGGWGME